MARPTAFSEDLARRLKRMLRQWESFRITGAQVAFHKGPDSASCHVETGPAGGGSRLAADLTTDGGSGTAPADFTYTPTWLNGDPVTNPDGSPVTGLTPKNRRDAGLDYVAADFGYLHRDSGGAWTLGWCNEDRADAEECQDQPS